MNAETYKATLDVTELLRELERLLLVQDRTDRLLCRYLADLADGIVNWPALLLAYGDVYEFVRAKFGLSVRSTRERVRVGRALRTLPVLDAALTSGQVTYSRIREVTRVAEPDTERVWLHAAQRLSVRALERRVAEAGGKSQARSRQPQRKHASEPEPGHVSVSVPREVWALVVQAMDVTNKAHGSELDNWQALAEVARSAMAHHGATPTDRPLVSGGPVADRMSGSTESGEGLTADTEGQHATHSGSRDSDTTESPTDHPDPAASTAATASSAAASSITQALDAGAEQPSGRVPTPKGFGVPAPAPPRESGVPTPVRPRETAKSAPRTDNRGQPLSPDVRLLYELIATGGDWNMVTLGEASGMPTPRLVTALVDLECAQLVNRDVMGFFEVRQKQAG